MNNYQELLPTGYQWVKKQSIFGYEPFSQLQPWYLLSEEKIFWVHKNWKTDKIPFFYEYQLRDNKIKEEFFDYNLFYKLLKELNFDENLNEFNEIYLIQGWTPEGFEIIETYKTFWEWLKSVIDDIQEWVELE